MSASITPICLLSSETSTDYRIHRHLRISTERSLLKNVILRLPPRAGNQSLRGYYLHRAHLACVVLSYILLRTSKPVSRLIKASCNPLSADEILSITVPISIRCASETAACPRRSFSASDRTLYGSGLLLPLSLGAGYWGFRVAKGLFSVLGGSGDTLRDDTSGSPASGAEESGGGVSLSIISGRRSHEDELI